jgi:hypothetical protein
MGLFSFDSDITAVGSVKIKKRARVDSSWTV